MLSSYPCLGVSHSFPQALHQTFNFFPPPYPLPLPLPLHLSTLPLKLRYWISVAALSVVQPCGQGVSFHCIIRGTLLLRNTRHFIELCVFITAYTCIRGDIQNIPDRCRHLYNSCGSAKHRSQQAKLWIPDSTATFCGRCVKTCEDFAPNFGENRPGCFTM
jgi:hypothetical protein